MKPRDYAYEALAEATSTDPKEGRGALNVALKSIREQCDISDSYLLANEIHERAKLYRLVMPDVILTPTALAKHWLRVFEESKRETPRTNAHATPTNCKTCSGDRFVIVGSRPTYRALKMKAAGEDTSGMEGYEELAPCPDCGNFDISYRRADGSMFHPPDPARVREMMNG